ncbi:PREDICTED: uncharacterized protein LOC109180484 [Ipomoea nil]|uniref:uncharacterized protein LOC109180484 n=1 Tax=Ipomoea nil TaxID=35883 RepID=UPI000900D3A5|nr:PREDICTED: uncharacterized protein LOC109180484 [Ipomoea nil]
MGKNLVILLLILLILLLGCSSASATPTAKVVCGVVTNVVAALFKWLVSLKSEMEPAFSRIKFEKGYSVETIFDGNKLGVEPYSVEVSPAGEVFILDSGNSNIYKITTPHSLYSRPMLAVGSPEGCSGHVDGKLREARMNHPKGLAMDDSGNMYVADAMNMAIRKITDTGVVTIAGGKRFQGDRPREDDAKLSNDFDVVYVRSSCSLLVIDRGNRAIKQVQLHEHDCSDQYDSNLHLGASLLFAACFFGYMLALLQRKVAAFSSSIRKHNSPIRPGLFPAEDEHKKPAENMFVSIGRLLVNTVTEMFGRMLSGFRKKPHFQQNLNLHYSHKHPEYYTNTIGYEDDLPFSDLRNPPPRTSSFSSIAKDLERSQNHHQKKQPSSPQACTEQSCERNEVVFGAIQEQDGCGESMVIKKVDYSDPAYNHYNIRSRYSCNMGSFCGN